MNRAAATSTSKVDQNIPGITSITTSSNIVSQNVSSDHTIGSSTSPPVLRSPNSQVNNVSALNTVFPPVALAHPYMNNMAAVAAAFLQGGFNPHMNHTPQPSCSPIHRQSHNPFLPPPPPPHGFIPELSSLVSTSTPKPFVTTPSVPLQPHRILRSPPSSSDKSLLDDSGIGGMSSTSLTPDSPAANSSTGSNSSSSNSLKRKAASNSINEYQRAVSTNSITNSSTPTSTMTRTHQYKKFMKPLLERKRRARINKCLDELKEIMTAALTSQGENVSKLEKADILELTVRHLNKMHQARRLMVSTNRNPLEEIHRFQAGYSSCAQEAASFLLSTPGVDVRVSQRLLSHLSSSSFPTRGPFGPTHSPLPPSFPATPPIGMAMSPNTIKPNQDRDTHHQNGIPPVQQPMYTSPPIHGGLSSPLPFQSRLAATATPRRRSSGGTSSASGSLISPKPVSSSSLPATSPTSSLTVDPPPRSSSLCDTNTTEAVLSINDKQQINQPPNYPGSPFSSSLSPGDKHHKESSSAHLTLSITAETKSPLCDDNVDEHENGIKLEQGCEKSVCYSDEKLYNITQRKTDSGKFAEIRQIPVKPEPIRLPNLHHQPHSISDPVWRPF